jgi:pyruvate kinase
LVWLFDESYGLVTPEEAEVCLPASSKWLNRLAKGDRIHFVDTSDRDRYLEVIHIEKHGVWAQSMNSAFVATGTILQHLSEHLPSPNPHETLIGVIPNIEGHLLLQCGDRLLLTPTMEPSTNAQLDKSGCVRRPARIGCTLPENFKDIRVGDSVWLDEGKIGGVVEQKDDSGLTIHILHARPNGEKLKGDKGINFPDSILRIPAMTKRDRINLRFVVEHADLVAMSFSSNRQDVVDLLNEIELIGNRRPGILLKIETRRGFENLPDMLLEAMKAPACGVIIARGDLAVEFGYQRLAEVQEEILRMCEAAHTPVILATQGLEKLAKQGIPSRVEISDTAMLNRAECVMLKKGTHILEAVEALDNILCRMQRQQNKKRSVVRELKLAKAFKSYA